MKTPVFVGASTALITPFGGGRVDYHALNDLIYRQKLAGSSAVTVCGTTGEAVTMTPREQREVIEFCVRHARGMKIIAGAGTNDTARTLQQARAAEDAGADAVLIVTPYYNKPSQAGLIRHFVAVADAVQIPVILYNVPSRTGVGLTAGTCRELARHPNINGIKEASGSLSLASELLTNVEEGFTLWSGNDDLTVPLMALGAKGVISVAGNIVPEVMVKLTGACLEGRFEEAAALHRYYSRLFSVLFRETNPIPVKSAAALLGLCREEYRLPLCPPAEETRQTLRETLAGYALI